ncbi:hypothetical protein GE118_02835 [Mycoplasma sp. NEAQ87857]|uniref:IS1634 family transposase n=1 Tax=Mycoplasma sp. NEAQ87857 TaxID=2683967 RepID=UPI00131672D7|nr:hypothetical protein [Mycoplasma sp. NEAQ87857]QGZ97727.1 hypothetical protein GE118_02835 [Mycoplasma sp. NEAQ87857]
MKVYHNKNEVIMFKKDLLVAVPKNTILLKKNNNSYVYLNVSIKEIRKNKSIIYDRKCIGKLVNKDLNLMNPNDNFFIYFPNQTNIVNNKIFSSSLSIGLAMAFEKIVNDLGLDIILREIFEDKFNLIKAISLYYLDSQQMSLELFEKWAYHNYTNLNSIPSNSTIFNFLSNSITEDEILAFQNAWALQVKYLFDESPELLLSLDSINLNTFIKENRFIKHLELQDNNNLFEINLSYALENQTGLPIFYELFPNAKTNQNYYQNVINRCDAYRFNNICLLLDKADFCSNDLNFLDQMDKKFIAMVKGYNKDIKNLVLNNKELIIDNVDYLLDDFTLYGMKLHQKIFDYSSKDYYVYLFYNDKQRAIQKESFSKLCSIFKKQLERQTYLTNDVFKNYRKYLNFEANDKNQIMSIQNNKDTVKEIIEYGGLFSLVSNQNYDLEKVISIYQKKDIINKLFKGLKYDFDLNKNNNYNQNVLESKIFLTFITAIVKSYINYKCFEFFNNHPLATIDTIMTELSKVEVLKMEDKYLWKYPLTEQQKEIFTLIGIDDKFITDFIIELNKTII